MGGGGQDPQIYRQNHGREIVFCIDVHNYTSTHDVTALTPTYINAESTTCNTKRGLIDSALQPRFLYVISKDGSVSFNEETGPVRCRTGQIIVTEWSDTTARYDARDTISI